ncbi:hypothetical protein BRADI_4g30195v3 [Brachypodium distachyon]|uniref:Uncharacterized protein n=1 Tax=Brachypodium distachyon TaxID=15368 RepID=A0A0Q3PLE4_BRADI|nr:hypothetical protein BRADI_4g30195v3 [Brachypodium distachyon]
MPLRRPPKSTAHRHHRRSAAGAPPGPESPSTHHLELLAPQQLTEVPPPSDPSADSRPTGAWPRRRSPHKTSPRAQAKRRLSPRGRRPGFPAPVSPPSSS